MIIAEAPAKEELNNNVEGVPMPIPLCGKAGRLLHNMLKWADITEGDFILTNVIKSGLFDESGKVRGPNEEEIIGTSSYSPRKELEKEISKVSPKLILLLGKTPLWTLFYHSKNAYEDTKIGIHVGKIMYYETMDYTNKPVKIPAIPLYHPSAILRDEDLSRGFKEATTKALLNHKDLISTVLGRIML
jgi:uracil-DNA glycosylase family 4